MAESTKTQYVIDASYILAYLLPDEHIQEVEEMFEGYSRGDIIVYATSLLYFEVLNGLRTAILRKRISSEVAYQLIDNLLKLSIFTEPVSFEKVFLISQEENLTIYDASYLWLAKTKNLPLLSLDIRLQDLSKSTHY